MDVFGADLERKSEPFECQSSCSSPPAKSTRVIVDPAEGMPRVRTLWEREDCAFVTVVATLRRADACSNIRRAEDTAHRKRRVVDGFGFPWGYRWNFI